MGPRARTAPTRQGERARDGPPGSGRASDDGQRDCDGLDRPGRRRSGAARASPAMGWQGCRTSPGRAGRRRPRPGWSARSASRPHQPRRPRPAVWSAAPGPVRGVPPGAARHGDEALAHRRALERRGLPLAPLGARARGARGSGFCGNKRKQHKAKIVPLSLPNRLQAGERAAEARWDRKRPRASPAVSRWRSDRLPRRPCPPRGRPATTDGARASWVARSSRPWTPRARPAPSAAPEGPSTRTKLGPQRGVAPGHGPRGTAMARLSLTPAQEVRDSPPCWDILPFTVPCPALARPVRWRIPHDTGA